MEGAACSERNQPKSSPGRKEPEEESSGGGTWSGCVIGLGDSVKKPWGTGRCGIILVSKVLCDLS